MAFPADLTLVTVTCQADLLPDGGAAGSVTITYDGQLTGSSIVPYVDETEPFVAGACTITVPATNDPQWTPLDFTYTVTVMAGGRKRYGTLQLDYQDTAVNLHELIQWSTATVTPGVTYATLAQLTTGLAGKSDTGHTHTASNITDFTAAVTALLPVNPRVADAGEYVIERGQVSTESPASTGNLYVTHFTAAVTETIQTIRTGIGSGEATSATHAWIGIMSWDGTDYTPVAASVDDPTRWATEFVTYDTQLFQWDHAGEDAFKGWSKVAGQDYAMWVLWIGSGDAPSLFAGGGSYQDSLEAPRTNAYISSQTQPPAAPISGSFFGLDSRRFQGLMKR